MKLKTFRIGGIHPHDNKLTAEKNTVVAPLPEKAYFLLSQHIGSPAKAVVKRGDKVKVGTLLAEAGGFVSAPIYSSVSGTVAKIDSVADASGYLRPAIIVDVEGDEWEETIDRSNKLEKLEDHSELTAEEIIQRVKNAGITGMGGAGFPTFIKLTPPPTAKAECLVINGVECEPYITADYRLMMEHTDEIMEGIKILMKAVNVSKAYIGIEANKQKTIDLFEMKTYIYPNIKIVGLKKRYPQGGEKQLVDACIRRQVPAPPAIPVDVGAIVQNVATVYAVYQAVMKNKPLLERYTTVTGKEIAEQKNYLVRIGTPVGTLLEDCGGVPDKDVKILSGGPMMGRALASVETPICKGTNAITVLSGAEAYREEESTCIRCGKCVSACPMGLEPYLLSVLSEQAKPDLDRLEKEDIVSCISCGCCQFTCPAYRPLLDAISIGKNKVMGAIRARNVKK